MAGLITPKKIGTGNNKINFGGGGVIFFGGEGAKLINLLIFLTPKQMPGSPQKYFLGKTIS